MAKSATVVPVQACARQLVPHKAARPAPPQIVMLQVCRQGGAHICHTRDVSDLLTCSLTFAGFAGSGPLRTEHVRQRVFFARGQARIQAGESAAAGGKRPPLSAVKVEGYAGCKGGRWE